MGEERITLSTDMEHLDLAPAFYPWKMGNPQYEADIYRFFKIETKWTAGSKSAGIFDSMNLLGLSVNNRMGKFYGLVGGVLIDSEGHTFVIVNHGDRDLTGSGGINTPIPFVVLRISKAQAGPARIVVNRDMEHLDSAPFFDPTKENNRQFAESIYLYWGVES